MRDVRLSRHCVEAYGHSIELKDCSHNGWVATLGSLRGLDHLMREAVTGKSQVKFGIGRVWVLQQFELPKVQSAEHPYYRIRASLVDIRGPV